MSDSIFEILQYSFPTLVSGFIAYYLFSNYLRSENRRQQIELIRDKKKEMLPIRLQAYERMTLVMERINPSKLLIRIIPTSEGKELYSQKLIISIEQEFEHNLSQQIYISAACWSALVAAKNATIRIIVSSTKEKEVKSSHELRETILKKMIESEPPSNTGIAFIKEEVKELF